MAGTTIADMLDRARGRLATLHEGEGLDETAAALLNFAVCASVTSLDRGAIEAASEAALAAGATAEQLSEVVALVSGLGVHSLMASALPLARAAGLQDSSRPLDEARQRLWDQYIGTSAYWAGFSEYFPGFLDAVLRLSPPLFEAFLDYCAMPWRMGSVSTLTKELAAMACDITPGHRFVPGFELHLANAIALGAGRRAIEQAIAIAAAAPPHTGYGQ